MKEISMLGTCHEAQCLGHQLNQRLRYAIELIIEKHGADIILEEWRYDKKASFASKLETPALKWKNIGTPDEMRFKTSIERLNWDPPTCDPDKRIYDPKKPILPLYGPVAVQQDRETYMVKQIEDFMQPHNSGLLILGLAHLHSMLVKLEGVGYDVRGYSWIELK